MSVDELKAEYDRRLKEALIAEIDDIPQTVTDAVAEVVDSVFLRALGLRRTGKYGDLVVDHGAHTHNSIALELGKHVMEQVKLAIPDFIEKLCQPDGPLYRRTHAAMRKEFAEVYGRELRVAVYDAAQTAARTMTQQALEKIVNDNPPADE